MVSVNDELNDFFFSGHGIRQDCLLSPYLYVLANNVLSLNKSVVAGHFGYHPSCKEVGLKNLIIDDDIMVFTNGTADSLHGVTEVLKGFANISSLGINVAKSTLFPVGRGKHLLKVTAAEMGISTNILHIRYLGLPLTTKTITKLEYETLVDKIRSRFLSWPIKYFLYAGRL